MRLIPLIFLLFAACKPLRSGESASLKDVLIAPDDHFVLLYDDKESRSVCLAQCSNELYEALDDVAREKDAQAAKRHCAVEARCIDKPTFIKRWIALETSMKTLKARILGDIASEDLAVINPFPTLLTEQVEGWERLNAGLVELEAWFAQAGRSDRSDRHPELVDKIAAAVSEHHERRNAIKKTRADQLTSLLPAETSAKLAAGRNFWDVESGVFRRVDDTPSCLVSVDIILGDGLRGRVETRPTFDDRSQPPACQKPMSLECDASKLRMVDESGLLQCEHIANSRERVYLAVLSPTVLEFTRVRTEYNRPVVEKLRLEAFGPMPAQSPAAGRAASSKPTQNKNEPLCTMRPTIFPRPTRWEGVTDAEFQQAFDQHLMEKHQRVFFEGTSGTTLEHALAAACDACIEGTARHLASFLPQANRQEMEYACAQADCRWPDGTTRKISETYFFDYRDGKLRTSPDGLGVAESFFRRCGYTSIQASSARDPTWIVDRTGRHRQAREPAWMKR